MIDKWTTKEGLQAFYIIRPSWMDGPVKVYLNYNREGDSRWTFTICESKHERLVEDIYCGPFAALYILREYGKEWLWNRKTYGYKYNLKRGNPCNIWFVERWASGQFEFFCYDKDGDKWIAGNEMNYEKGPYSKPFEDEDEAIIFAILEAHQSDYDNRK
jgi:hypothetical protein